MVNMNSCHISICHALNK